MIKTWQEDQERQEELQPQLAKKMVFAGLGLVAAGGLLYLLAGKTNQEYVDLVPVDDDRGS